MKILKELAIITGILFISHILQKLTGIPIPASVLGMMIMLICLVTGVLKIDSIETVTRFLLDNLTILFIPGGVSLITSYVLIKGQVIKILIIAILTGAIGIAVAGLTVKLLNKGEKETAK